MKTLFTGLAVAVLLLAGASLPGYADDTATPTAAQPPAAGSETPPPSVPRPSIVPKAASPASAPVAAEPAPRHRHYARRHWRRYSHTTYWEPFPVYLPHLYRNRIHWSRVSWFHF